jgi:glycine/D-amino acid oxidase-like deaminating enzyme
MQPDILIVGQGLAGTLLAWELERAGLSFAIVDAGHGRAASRVAAGVINPITGQRIVKSWRVDTLLPVARETYHAIEKEWGLLLWRDMRVRRFYLNEDERRVLAEKQARGELADYAGATDGDGFWIEGAARVDVAGLVQAARARWLATGRLRQEHVDFASARPQHGLVIDCTGASGSPFSFVPWQYSKGECLTLAMDGLAADVVLNRGHWILPLAPGRAMIGATHSPGRRDIILTVEARTALEGSIASMSAHPYTVTEHDAGVRAYVPDKKPVVGRHPLDERLGIMNAMGAKGALFAPALARQWVTHLTDGTPFDREMDVVRLFRRQAVPAAKLTVAAET